VGGVSQTESVRIHHIHEYSSTSRTVPTDIQLVNFYQYVHNQQ